MKIVTNITGATRSLDYRRHTHATALCCVEMPPTRPRMLHPYALITADTRRLAAVRATGLPAGRGSRDRFARLAALAARLLHAPVALISLVDADRDVWVGMVGIPDELAALGGTTVRPSFCQAIIANTGQELAVGDARSDPVFRTFPSVSAFGLVACLGVPLVTREAQALGSCCVYDMLPRHWTSDDIDALHAIAAVATIEMERLSGAVGRDANRGAVVARYLGAALDTVDMFSRFMPSRDDAERITRVSHAAGAVARQFAMLLRPLPDPSPAPPALDLGSAVHDAWRLMQVLSGDNALVTLDLPDALSPVAIDPPQFLRILVALVRAARDAIAGRGWIAISAAGTVHAHGADVRLIIRGTSPASPHGAPIAFASIAAAAELLDCYGGRLTLIDGDAAVVATFPRVEV